MKARNLHIVYDSNHSNWYIEKCLKYGADYENEFVVLSNKPRYITHQAARIEPIDESSLQRIAAKINNDAGLSNLVIHYLEMIPARLLKKIDRRDLPITWVVWGADLYNLPKFWRRIYDPYAAKFLGVSWTSEFLGRYDAWKQRLRHGKKDHTFIYSAIKKVTHIGTLTKPDFELVKQRLNHRVKQVEFSLSGMEDFGEWAEREDLFGRKNDVIQVGNSGHPSNNHYEVLLMLHEMKLQNRIFIPLAYGKQHYIEKLLSDLPSLISMERVELQQDFIAKEKYYEKLTQTGFAIMGHNRQQSFGNLAALFYFGSKIFLKRKNPLCRLFDEWGLKYYHIENDLNAKAFSSPLDPVDAHKNREIIRSRIGESKMREYYTNIMRPKKLG